MPVKIISTKKWEEKELVSAASSSSSENQVEVEVPNSVNQQATPTKPKITVKKTQKTQVQDQAPTTTMNPASIPAKMEYKIPQKVVLTAQAPKSKPPSQVEKEKEKEKEKPVSQIPLQQEPQQEYQFQRQHSQPMQILNQRRDRSQVLDNSTFTQLMAQMQSGGFQAPNEPPRITGYQFDYDIKRGGRGANVRRIPLYSKPC